MRIKKFRGWNAVGWENGAVVKVRGLPGLKIETWAPAHFGLIWTGKFGPAANFRSR
jgi:hypothetical protein